MKNINLRSFFIISMTTIAFFLILLLFSVRLLSVSTMLHQQERDHLRSVVDVVAGVQLGDQLRMFTVDEKDSLVKAALSVAHIATFPERDLLALERSIVAVAGFGEALDIAAYDAVEAAKLAEAVKLLPAKTYLSGNDIASLEDRANKLLDNGDKFAPVITSAVSFIQKAAFIIIGSAVAVIFVVFFLLFRNITIPIIQIGKSAEKLGRGDLDLSDDESNEYFIEDFQNLHLQITTAKTGLIGIVKGLRNSRLELGQSITAVNEGVTTIATNISEQSVAASSVSSAVEQVTASTAEISATTEQATEQASEASELSQEGSQNVLQAIGSNNAAVEMISELTESLDIVDTNTSSIRGILNIINSITEQTNLLALNAAIEAARAGEYGRGFSVVADEVRQLAKRTSESTDDIETMIDELCRSTEKAIQKALECKSGSESSRALATSAGESLDKVTERIASLASINQLIDTATREQKQCSEEINRNIHGIVENMEEANITTQAIVARITDLARVDQDMSTIIEQFTVVE